MNGADHSPAVQGHFDGELWGLAVHPSGKEYVTVGEDNQIMVWDSEGVCRTGTSSVCVRAWCVVCTPVGITLRMCVCVVCVDMLCVFL